VDEEKINNMAYTWFNLVLEALGKRINYESISNIYGNSFAKDSAKVVQAANPLIKNGGRGNASIMDLAGKIKVVDTGDKQAGIKAAEKNLGDLSWAEGLF
jgi:hypothetical protein